MKWVAAIAFAMMLVLPEMAAAQSVPGSDMNTGSRFKKKVKTYDEGDVRAMQKKMARCIADTQADDARKILQNSDPTQIDFEKLGIESDELFEEIGMDNCLQRAMPRNSGGILMEVDFATLRNLLAEEIYLKDYDGPLTLADDAGEVIEDRFVVGGMTNQRTTMMVVLADCIVLQDAVGAHDFIATKPGSKKEERTAKALHPVVDECARQPISGQVETGMMRRIVADGLWTRAYHQALAAQDLLQPTEASGGQE